MGSRELLKGTEVDLNKVMDTFVEEVEEGAPLTFGTFKDIWKAFRASFLLVCAASEGEIASHVQELFMCALDRFDLPSPLKYGHLFGDLHRPRLRRANPADKLLVTPATNAEVSEIEGMLLKQWEQMENHADKQEEQFCDCFKDAPDFPKNELNPFITLEDRVAAIYALHCIYNEQCLEPRSRIHIPVDLLQLFVEFLPKLMKSQVLDAVYIFQDLWKQNAFVFDVIRRPPGFLCLPLETSVSETSALRELSFHLKTSLKDLSHVDKIEKACDEYTALQQQLVRSRLGKKLKASKLMTFNGDIGRWLRSVTAQETQQVHEGITGLKTKQKTSVRKERQLNVDLQPNKLTGKEAKDRKRKFMESLPQITISTTDSWGINAPGLPKMARLVMMRDKQRRRKEAQEMEEHTVEVDKQTSGVLGKSLHSEDFYKECSHLNAFRSEEHSGPNRELVSDDFYKECSQLRMFRSSGHLTDPTLPEGEEAEQSPGTSSLVETQDYCPQTEAKSDMTDDDEIRQWQEELIWLNEEIREPQGSPKH